MKGLGLGGRKVGMTKIYTKEGIGIPVTVLDMSGNSLTQIKLPHVDGYSALQLAFSKCRASNLTKPQLGHFAKAGVEACSRLIEFRVDENIVSNFQLGHVFSVGLFEVGGRVDVRGVSIGKGYAGTIKRYSFSSGRASHGNSRAHNVPGSIGMCQDPGRVFPGKKMTGHMGAVSCVVQSLVVVRVDSDRQLLFVKGSVPGPKNGWVVVTHAVKHSLKKGYR